MYIKNNLEELKKYIAILFLYIFGASWILSTAVMYISLLGIIAITILDIKSFYNWAQKYYIFWISIAWIGWLILRTILPTEFNIGIEKKIFCSYDMVFLGGFPALFITYWLYSSRIIKVFIILLSLAIIVNFFAHIDYINFQKYIAGSKEDFGLRGNGAGLFGIFLMSICVAFGALDKNNKLTYNFIKFIYFTLCFIIGMFMLIVDQSRGIWIAFLSMTFLLIIIFFITNSKFMILRKLYYNKKIILFTTVAIILVLVLFRKAIFSRMTHESTNWEAAISLNFNKLKSSSIGYRIGMWYAGINQFKKQPIIGSGPGTAPKIITNANFSVLKDKTWPNFHNTYIHILVTTGVVGFVIYIIYIFTLIRSCIKHKNNLHTKLHENILLFVMIVGPVMLIEFFFAVKFDDVIGKVLILTITSLALSNLRIMD